MPRENLPTSHRTSTSTCEIWQVLNRSIRPLRWEREVHQIALQTFAVLLQRIARLINVSVYRSDLSGLARSDLANFNENRKVT